MTLPFNKNIINDEEITPINFINAKFVGFLNPSGMPIDYSAPFGLGGHDRNNTTDLFTRFFYIRYREYDCNGYISHGNPEEEEKTEMDICANKLKCILEKLNSVNSEIQYRKQYNNEYNINIDSFYFNDIMVRDLLQFFKNCYLNGSFNKGFGKNVRFMDEIEFRDRDFKPIHEKCLKLYPKEENESYWQYDDRIPPYYRFEDQYEYYISRMLLDLLKETFICYLGYHSIERIPRTITTSEFNIYETFYNYLLNDFSIVRLPKMIYNNDQKMYEEYAQNEFLVPERELILKDEIESIKRMVPPNERYKYYR